jgi:aminopeptidase N
VIPAARLRRGENTVRIDFRAGDAPLNRSDDLLYTWFVPANARRSIPCFDQPDLKGRWTLTLEHPAQWQSVANGAERDRQRIGDRVRVRFQPTRPLPTYVMGFVVGDMKIETATRAGRTMRMLHRETDAAKLARNREALFDLHAQALERYTGIPYPFGKFDFVLVPAFLPGAMEHAGNIAYKAENLLLDESATETELLARAHLIAHETAHMWFGNLVTMRWFDDVWTKEVFANFIADKRDRPDGVARRLRSRLRAGGRRGLGLRRVRTRCALAGLPANRHPGDRRSAIRWFAASPGPPCGTRCSAVASPPPRGSTWRC